MERRLVACTFLLQVILLSLQAWAIDCEKGSLSIRADSGNYAYGELKCTSYSELYADYSGNLSQDLSVFVEGDGNDYTVSLLADATERSSGIHRGTILLLDDDGEELEIPVRVRIGEGSDEEISLSKYGLSFELDEAGLEECYNVSVRNTGNAELWDLHADYGDGDLAAAAYNNKSWIYISDLGDPEFPAGEERGLQICANTKRTKGNNLPNQENSIIVSAEGSYSGKITEEITVSLKTDLGTAWQKNYEELLEEHGALEANYSRMRAYKEAWEERYVNGSASLYTYSALSKAYKELKAEYSALEKELKGSDYPKYDNLSISLSNLASLYDALESNYSSMKKNAANMSDKAEASILENKSMRLKEDTERIRSSLETMKAALEEKEAILSALLAKQKKNETAQPKTETNDKGFFDEYVPFIPMLAVPFAAIFVILIVTSRRNKHRAIKKEADIEFPVVKNNGEDAKEKEEEQRRLKEQQKEALRQMIMQKLAEKAAEKKNG